MILSKPIGFLGIIAYSLLYGTVFGLGTYTVIRIVQRTMPKKRKGQTSNEKPEKWIRVGHISKLVIYPIKSCQGIEVNEARLTPLGLQGLKCPQFLRDRIFVIVDEQGVFQTQRNYPRLALIGVDIREDCKLVLSAPEKESITVDLQSLVPVKHDTIRIWTDFLDKKDVLDLGDSVGLWLDSFLNVPGFRIIYHATDSTKRKLTTRYKKYPMFEPHHTGAFQDDTAYLLMTSESIEVVSQRLEAKNAGRVSHRNFRPCILVEGIPDPFSEDDWSFVRIGNKVDGPILKASLPCSRCRLTTVDPDKGTFNELGEPLKTLQTELQRTVGDSKMTERVKNQGILGTQLGLFDGDQAVVKAGDPIFAALL